MRNRSWWVAALLVAALVPGEARAQHHRGHEEPVDPAREEAQRHFEAGVALMNVENWEAAMLEFQRSLEIYPTRSALLNYGMCLKGLYRYVEAMHAFEQFQTQYRDVASRDELGLLDENMEQLRALLGELLIGVTPAGATVIVDDVEVGTAPLDEPVQVVSGRHTVVVRLDGYIEETRQTEVTAGDRVTVAFELAEIPHVGTLRVEANVADAEVWVDGALAGRVPYEASVAEGSHEVRVSAEGYVQQTQAVSLATGESRIVTVTLTEPSGTDPAWFWSMVGLTGAAGVATIALGTMVIIKDDEYRSTSYPGDALYDEGKNLQLATDVCLAVTIAAAVTAGVLGFTTNWGGDEESAPDEEGGGAEVGAMFGPTPDGLTLGVVGRF
ncbi:MAG: PEGA domain-containing protein [Deltaproteobacteria bacterium]|nr:PEGA domain-containing protein [Deltaproteobacteria bacterium]